MTYKEYRQQEQEAFNALPVFFAFSNEQFKQAMEERGLTENDTDKIYRLGKTGGFYLKTDADKIKAYLQRDNELDKLLDDYDFAKEAFYYEMCNHEYGINYQRYWDVFGCFSTTELPFLDESEDNPKKAYFDYLGWDDTRRKAYNDAEQKYYKAAKENDWF